MLVYVAVDVRTVVMKQKDISVKQKICMTNFMAQDNRKKNTTRLWKKNLSFLKSLKRWRVNEKVQLLSIPLF